MLRNSAQQQTDHSKAVQLDASRRCPVWLPQPPRMQQAACASPIHAYVEQGSNKARDLPAALPLSQAEPLECRTQVRLGALAVQVQQAQHMCGLQESHGTEDEETEGRKGRNAKHQRTGVTRTSQVAEPMWQRTLQNANPATHLG